MAKRMLIDAAHPEETRVVVVSGNRVEEFDFETAAKKQLKGNIYLAKVTRVEPSLQAAFVEYGGNRHGFLAFSEIHPDYYQIPVEDRLALMREEEETDEEDEEEDTVEARAGASSDEGEGSEVDAGTSPAEDETAAEGAAEVSDSEEDAEPASADERSILEDEGLAPIEISEPVRIPVDEAASNRDEAVSDGDEADFADRAAAEIIEVSESKEADAAPESVGAEDALEELPRRRRRLLRRYKIQEVIKRRQILLVQVVKEERGTKGAALTTYLSLAGRYCVLMPNTDRGGGISRKITSGQDRKRLKDIATELEVPEGMGLIIRTAGANRTRPELKRDFEYLLRLWESVRELTLKSTAPALVYEEGNLVKRSIRDLYGRDIESVLVEGEEAYKEAKAFMKMLTPSHAKNVQQYRDKMPLFQRYQVESQLDSLYSPRVELKSGGYIVLNATEALVAIDVNSGKATREHSIEETAHRTNLEAAAEVARQLRLRDLAGLIVIDFIDMEEQRHNRSVERRLKEHLKTDRARIQVGRISAFGLLEMSRQRLRASVLEGSTLVCPHCTGAGRVPSVETQTLRILRAIEEEGIRGRLRGAHVKAPGEVALYLLNHKREILRQIEERFGLPCYIEVVAELKPGQFSLEREEAGLIDWQPAQAAAISPESAFIPPESEPEIEVEASHEEGFKSEPIEIEAHPSDATHAQGGEDRGERRRRRRRGGRSRGRDRDYNGDREQRRGQPRDDSLRAETGEGSAEFDGERTGEREDGESGRRRRRRGRRGGRRNRRDRGEAPKQQGAMATDAPQPYESDPRDDAHEPSSDVSNRASGNEDRPPTSQFDAEPERDFGEAVRDEGTASTKGRSDEPRILEGAPPQPEPEIEDPNRPRKKGWWQKRLFG